MAQLLLQNRSSGESTSPNLLPSWTFILWNPASSFGRARGGWSLRHHFCEPAGEIHKDTLGNHLVPAPCHGQHQLALPQPMTPTWRTASLNIVLRWRGRITFTVDHRHEASGLQKSNAYHQSHHKNYFTRHFLWPSAARPLPCPNSGELLADITPLAPHAVFGVSWPMTYNSMHPGRGGSSSLNTDLPTSSVFRVQQQESYGRENGLGILWLTIGPTQVLAAAFLCGRVWRHFLGLRDSHHEDPLRQVQPEA